MIDYQNDSTSNTKSESISYALIYIYVLLMDRCLEVMNLDLQGFLILVVYGMLT